MRAAATLGTPLFADNEQRKYTRFCLSAIQTRKNANQTTPRINTASPVDTVNNASTEGPGSA
jgi:hypothetical protein